MNEEPKYLTDASLAGLTKWLRLLGYDTAVYNREAGREMLRFAVSQGRTVLTKRQDMLSRQFSGSLCLITGRDVGSQLKEVLEKLAIKVEKKKMFQICLSCNERLSILRKEEARDSVPDYVFARYSEFTSCPRCESIYWPGTHQLNSLQYLENLGIKPV